MPTSDNLIEKTVANADRSSEYWISSKAAASLKRLHENPRVNYIVLVVPVDACPACQILAGTYLKTEVPSLPLEICSHPNGCRAYYLPHLDEIYP